MSAVSIGVFAQDYVTQYTYDARGRLIKAANSSADEVYYTLDDAGNRLNVSDSPYQPTLPVITSFTGPSSVSYSGKAITLIWASTDTTHCTLVESGSSANPPNLSSSGSKSVNIYETTAYTLTCYDAVTSDSKAKFIRVTSDRN
ncbi:hypothetical protein A3Q34_18255 [Colwellia sp. PAMC 20917]|nr:hypothetical protein A3Q34_18255 [Colwellia sp. PAMC 20917]